jgi:hypothetical protein
VVSHPNLDLAEKRAIVGVLGVRCFGLRARTSLKAPVTIDEILEALCALDGGPRHPSGGKPMRRHSTERRAAA